MIAVLTSFISLALHYNEMKRSQAGQSSGEEENPNIAVKSFISKKSKLDASRIQASPSSNYSFLQNVFSTASFPEVFPATVVHSETNATSDHAIHALELPVGMKTSQEVPDFLHYSSSEEDHDVYERSRLRPLSTPDVDPSPAVLNQKHRERQLRFSSTSSPLAVPSYSKVKFPSTIRASRPTMLTSSASHPSQSAFFRSENVTQPTSPVPARLLTKAEILHLQNRTAATLSPSKVVLSSLDPPGQSSTLPTTSVAPLSDEYQDASEKLIEDHRKFACSSCTARFSRRANLNRHQLVHTRVRQFKCPLCTQDFSLSGNLKRHVNNVHKTKL